MHALDEEEMQMEELTKNIEELENLSQKKNLEIQNLEASRGKLMKKVSITISKFDELHHLCASLLAEVEKLQCQLQERDADISFLRQEVTRCTNDVLLASQMNKKKSSDEIFEFLEWIDMMVSQEGIHDMCPDVKSDSQVNEYKEMLRKKLLSVLSELEDLRVAAESKDELLQVERSKVEELTHKAETLELSLHQKESQLNLLEDVGESGGGASTSLEVLEVEPVTEKWTAAGTSVTPQVRSLRKGNNDHVAIAVDVDPGSTSRIEDEDDDKVHGFKSLTYSRIVPRFTRPLTDMIDGLWVSCDRTLMRQPTLRLGIIIYWALMHLLLAFSVV
ncbi:centromere-associated protein E isoform X1 [Senna tora]|uniref:Centromere-associated protein E isoform X1 n=1 Tax=Senna tora TaxID=362788 RepID=A0A834WRV2_9FABA|nr:centromere-associated protein E isoform X1 [Senna tora]